MHASVLRYFSEVARRGSIRKASEALHVASSAVNRQILNLEAEIGVALFERLANGVRLTPAGEILLRHVRETLYEYERIRAEIDDLRGLKSGHVKIVAVDSLMVSFLPQAIADFARTYPRVTYAALALGPADVTDEVASGRADVGLSFVPESQGVVETLSETPTPMGVIARPDHPLAGRRYVTLAECARYPVLLQSDTLPLTPVLEAEFAASGNDISPRIVSNSIELMKQMVRANQGIAFFTKLGFTQELARGEFVHVALAEPRFRELKIGIIVPKHRKLAIVTAIMVEHLRAALERLA